jgi:hypothetical protein
VADRREITERELGQYRAIILKEGRLDRERGRDGDREDRKRQERERGE